MGEAVAAGQANTITSPSARGPLGESSIIDCLVFGRIAGKSVMAGSVVQKQAAE
jgi:succinate dehydrogenase/fumarate reductase flavoprotein subunit